MDPEHWIVGKNKLFKIKTAFLLGLHIGLSSSRRSL
jgi:hypothetical protein